jgi:hypothetical protein
MLKIQKKREILLLAERIVEIKKDTLNLDVASKLVFKNIINLEKILFNLKTIKKEIIEKVKKFTRPINKKFIVNQIRIEYGEILNILV